MSLFDPAFRPFPDWTRDPAEWDRQYARWVAENPDRKPDIADSPESDWSVVVFGSASMNTVVTARTAEEAERRAIEGFRDGDLTFDDPWWGRLDAEAEPASPTTPAATENQDV